jgi:glycosyltransferase involved in cell wall biosynthesis
LTVIAAEYGVCCTVGGLVPVVFLSGMATAESSDASFAVERSQKRRVVMLVNRLRRGGGAERAMVALATHLPRDRFEVTVVTTRPAGGPLLDTLVARGVRHVSLNRRGRLDLAPFRRFIALLRDERIDIIHAHMFGSNFWGAVLGRLAGVPVVIAHEHSWSYEGEPVRRFLDGHVIGRLAHAFVAVSERDRTRMMMVEGVPPEKIIVLPNPYLPRPRSESLNLRAHLRIPAAAPLIATVAVLRPEKALEVLLQAFAELSAMIPHAMLVIGGDGPCRGVLEQQARDIGISERVRFMGWWHDVGGLLEAADVAAMTSDREGAPLFALECMAHMTPLVSTDVGNISELLGEGQGVVTVPRRDPQAMAHALAALLRDPERRAAQASAAAERLPPYEIDNVTREFIELYDRLFEAASKRHTKAPEQDRSTLRNR